MRHSGWGWAIGHPWVRRVPTFDMLINRLGTALKAVCSIGLGERRSLSICAGVGRDIKRHLGLSEWIQGLRRQRHKTFSFCLASLFKLCLRLKFLLSARWICYFAELNDDLSKQQKCEGRDAIGRYRWFKSNAILTNALLFSLTTQLLAMQWWNKTVVSLINSLL